MLGTVRLKPTRKLTGCTVAVDSYVKLAGSNAVHGGGWTPEYALMVLCQHQGNVQVLGVRETELVPGPCYRIPKAGVNPGRR